MKAESCFGLKASTLLYGAKVSPLPSMSIMTPQALGNASGFLFDLFVVKLWWCPEEEAEGRAGGNKQDGGGQNRVSNGCSSYAYMYESKI